MWRQSVRTCHPFHRIVALWFDSIFPFSRSLLAVVFRYTMSFTMWYVYVIVRHMPFLLWVAAVNAFPILGLTQQIEMDSCRMDKAREEMEWNEKKNENRNKTKKKERKIHLSRAVAMCRRNAIFHSFVIAMRARARLSFSLSFIRSSSLFILCVCVLFAIRECSDECAECAVRQMDLWATKLFVGRTRDRRGWTQKYYRKNTPNSRRAFRCVFCARRWNELLLLMATVLCWLADGEMA